MSRIDKSFSQGKAFIAFITGGDPDIDTTEELIYTMEKAGADLIEIGIPFSDPIAEGEIIQEANKRALRAGCTTDKLFEMVKRVRMNSDIPLVFLTYVNPIYTYGKERFFKKCQETGIDGVIVPDLPFEEKEELLSECNRYGVDLISLIAPTSNSRIAMIAREAKGFIYCVSSLGVTGVRDSINTDIKAMVDEVKKVSNIPCAVGFGISNSSQAKELSLVADGIIVGSAIVKIIEQEGINCLKFVYEYVKKMKDALD